MTAKEKIRYGLQDLHVFSVEYADGTYTFGTPERLEGTASLKMDPNVNVEKHYADNHVYYISRDDKGYSSELEMYLFQDDFYTKYMGMRKSTEGNLVESDSDEPKPFGMIFRIESDKNPTYHVVFLNEVTSKPGYDLKTTEDKRTVYTSKLSIDSLPLLDGTGIIKSAVHKGDSNYDTLLTKAPTAPTFTVAA